MSQQDFSVIENNDTPVHFTLTRDGVAVDLSSATVEFHHKASRDDADGTPYTVASGEVEITDAAGGEVTVTLDAADFSTPFPRWYHLDVVEGGDRLTYAYGTIKVGNV